MSQKRGFFWGFLHKCINLGKNRVGLCFFPGLSGVKNFTVLDRPWATMAKHGTLPEYMYQRRNIVTERVDVFSDDNSSTAEAVDVDVEQADEASDTEENLDEVDEFDPSSDEEEDAEGLELHRPTTMKSEDRQTFYLGHGPDMEKLFEKYMHIDARDTTMMYNVMLRCNVIECCIVFGFYLIFHAVIRFYVKYRTVLRF